MNAVAEQVYILGLLASRGHVDGNKVVLTLRQKEYDEVLPLLHDTLSHHHEADNHLMTIQWSADILYNGCGPDEKNFQLPSCGREETWSFLRGFFDGTGTIHEKLHEDEEPCCHIYSGSPNMLRGISVFSRIPAYLTNDETMLVFTGTNALDFLGNIYERKYSHPCLREKHTQYLEWVQPRPWCEVFRVDKGAILPSREKVSDVGFDLTILRPVKKLGAWTTLYDTGIRINLQHGYYAEVYPRSSLSKSGYMLANSIGVIDPSYRNNIFIALTKVDMDAPDLVLPFRCCQMIVKKQIHCQIVEVDNDFQNTLRGQGGFGSTG